MNAIDAITVSSLNPESERLIELLRKSIVAFGRREDSVELASLDANKALRDDILRRVSREGLRQIRTTEKDQEQEKLVTFIIQKAYETARGELASLGQDNSAKVTPAPKGGLPLKTTTTPVSLTLDQMLAAANNGGSLLNSFVTIEQLKDCSNESAERLDLLNKIQHVEDIIMDWPEINVLLLDGLSGSNLDGYVQLHRKWLDWSRNSTEYRSIAIDLCSNLVKAVSVSRKLLVTTSVKAMAELVLQVFTRWMEIGDYQYVGNPQVEEIGVKILVKWTDFSIMHSSDGLILPSPLTKAIVSVDEDAKWLALWISHLNIDRLIEILDSGGNIPATDTWLYKALLYCNQNVVVSSSVDGDTRRMCRYILRCFRSILLATRVSRFPWSMFPLEIPTVSFGPPVAFAALELFTKGREEESEGSVSEWGDVTTALLQGSLAQLRT